MNNRITSLINFYKLDIYSGLASKDYIVQLIEKSIPGVLTDSGQKRVVAYDPQEPNYVYKIAFNEAGIMDNINEVATSNRLKELVNEGHLSNYDLGLFALAELLPNGDPVIIRQEVVTHYTQFPEYINWIKSSDVVNEIRLAGSLNEHQCFPIYVSRVQSLATDYNRIIEIMSQFFIPSDISVMREPKNYGIKNNQLCLLDMGSVIPMLTDINGNRILPTYGATNQPMVYVSTKITGPANIADLMTINPGKYVPINSAGISFNPDDYSVLDIDDAVFDRYIKFLCPNEYNRMAAIHGLWFVPSARLDVNAGESVLVSAPNNLSEYTEALYYETGIQFPGEMVMTMWNNYIYKRSALLLTNIPEVVSYPISQNVGGETMLSTLSDFNNIVIAALDQKGFNVPLNVYSTISGILYLKKIVELTGAGVDTLYNLTSSGVDDFVRLLTQIVPISNEEAYSIYNASTGMIY